MMYVTCMQLHKPFENLRDNSISPTIDIESSRHTDIEQGIELSIRLKYIGDIVVSFSGISIFCVNIISKIENQFVSFKLTS